MNPKLSIGQHIYYRGKSYRITSIHTHHVSDTETRYYYSFGLPDPFGGERFLPEEQIVRHDTKHRSMLEAAGIATDEHD